MPGQSLLHLRKHPSRQKASFFHPSHSLRLPFPDLQLQTGHHQLARLAPTGQIRADVHSKLQQEKALRRGQHHSTCTKGVVLPRRPEVQKIISHRERQHATLGPNQTTLNLPPQHLSIHPQATLPGGGRDQLKDIRFQTISRANPHHLKLSICSNLHDQRTNLVTRVKEATFPRTIMLRFATQAQTS